MPGQSISLIVIDVIDVHKLKKKLQNRNFIGGYTFCSFVPLSLKITNISKDGAFGFLKKAL